jgi:hypothetical protein
MRQSVLRITVLAAAITILAAIPATAGAATTGGGQFGAATLTVAVGQATLSQRVVVNVPVTVTCTLNPGAPPAFPQQGTTIQVDIVQAIGKSSTAGSGYTTGFACDGTEYSYLISVLASPTSGGLHFKKGPAVIQATASAAGYDDNFRFGTDFVSTGWMASSIK